jgi:hypothetical protein
LLSLLGLAVGLHAGALPSAQDPQGGQNLPPRPDWTAKAPKKIGENLVQLGNIIVDTKKKEATVTGRMLSDRTLEFIAATKDGAKSYESAMELDTNGVTFNLAMIMIGLEKANAVVPEEHFAPKAGGDPVEIWVELGTGNATRRIRAEELLYDERAKAVPKMGPWVYTGSKMYATGEFAADMDGVLIGFVHDPSSIIENVVGSGIRAYGTIKLNPALNIQEGTPVKVTVRALPRK